MGLIDFILFPLYVLLFHLFFSWRRKRIEDPILKKYQRQGFWIKVLGTLAITIFYAAISPGNDSTGLFYKEGINIAHLISEDGANVKMLFSKGVDFDQSLLADPFNRGYFNSEANYLVVKLVSMISFVSFHNYMVINLFFSMISYSGVWHLYRFFYEQHPHLHKKLAIAILYLPTFVFWSSVILKDPLSIGMLGWMTYAMYKAFIKKEAVFKNLLNAIVAGYLIAILKAYILFSYLPFFIVFLIISSLKKIEQKGMRIIIVASLLLISITIFFLVADRLQDEMGILALDKISESVKTQQNAFMNMGDEAASTFSLGSSFDGTGSSLVTLAPAAIAATFFRPYLWESKKLSTLLSSIESLALMIFTVFVFLKVGPVGFIKAIIEDPLAMYCFLFSIVFAVFVGATTLNFGTLVRYKIPCMPFYIIALVLILESKRNKQLSNASL
jgi:hypothetical protein